MNRLCIYVTYNKENKIKAYIGYMLMALREYTTTLYVVCNYPQILYGEEYVAPYADKIFYRENKGYDAGAYKDMLCTVLGWEKINQYDELILMNDSFLGPFYDFSEYFDLMEKISCDFWGMTRNFHGELKSIGYHYEPHIHSYFLVFRKLVLNSRQFRDFWENFVYPQTFTETILNYEIKLNECLEQAGFLPMAITDVFGLTFEENEIAYFSYSYELIRDRILPILKRKPLLIRNAGFANVLKSIDFIDDHRLYPVDWIWDMLDSQFYIENYAPDGTNCLEFFYNKFKKLYIYGAGVCGKSLALYFDYKGWKHDGILVSDKAGQDTDCILFDDVCIDNETGIVISVIHEEVSKEIVRYVETKSKCKRAQMFVIYDCKAIRLPK